MDITCDGKAVFSLIAGVNLKNDLSLEGYFYSLSYDVSLNPLPYSNFRIVRPLARRLKT